MGDTNRGGKIMKTLESWSFLVSNPTKLPHSTTTIGVHLPLKMSRVSNNMQRETKTVNMFPRPLDKSFIYIYPLTCCFSFYLYLHSSFDRVTRHVERRRWEYSREPKEGGRCLRDILRHPNGKLIF
jgi:hypothetical protein